MNYLKSHFKNHQILKMYNKFFKRVFDLLFSLLMILILIPPFFIICLMLKFTGEGEIFFLQERVGKDMKKFMVFKFATMLKNSPFMGDKIYTAQNDPRILKFGKFLRKSKINELPQLFNILIGDMSFVGPRPLINKTFDFYDDLNIKKIKMMRPGLTGLGSIFFSDESNILLNHKNKEEFYKNNIAPLKQDLETFYYDNSSFFIDLKIIFLTAYKIFRNSNDKIIMFFPELKNINEKINNL